MNNGFYPKFRENFITQPGESQSYWDKFQIIDDIDDIDSEAAEYSEDEVNESEIKKMEDAMNEVDMLNDEIEDIDSDDDIDMNQMYQMQAELLQGNNKKKAGPVIPGLSLGGIEGAGYGTKIQAPQPDIKKPAGLGLQLGGIKKA